MAKIERHLDILTAPPSPEYFRQKTSEGWTLAGIEWQREIEITARNRGLSSPPFGTRVAEDRIHLVGDPPEMEVLRTIMGLIVKEISFSTIAEELNLRGHLTRDGHRWTQTSVYCMLPRLIEIGPDIIKHEEWPRQKQLASKH
ncbi:MAG: hypothetical protein JWO13_2570 [Acidobacteriales bacterium]|nr:hypothetical protein [Terriglobales bacterium]